MNQKSNLYEFQVDLTPLRTYLGSMQEGTSDEDLHRWVRKFIYMPLDESFKTIFGMNHVQEDIDLSLRSYFVNVSRGAVVNEEALLKLLLEKKIAGAALDVIQKEPNTNSPFFELDNVICTPHIAGRTIEAGQRLEMTVAVDALRMAEGKKPLNLVNEEVLE